MPTFIGAGSGNNAFSNAVNIGLGQVSQDPITNGRADKIAEGASDIRAGQYRVQRTPWFMTTTEWSNSNRKKGILWATNPSDITWDLAQRSTMSKNLFGTVQHVWPDTKRNTYYDEYKLSFNLQSGNIMPVFVGANGRVQGYSESPGLSNFYDFMQLFDQPKLTQDGRTNLVFINYASNLFPKLTLIGQFDPRGIRFTDSSQNPNQVNSWTVDFYVYRTNPAFTDNRTGQQNNALIQRWLKERLEGAKLAQPDRNPFIGGNVGAPINVNDIQGLGGAVGGSSGVLVG